MMKPQLHCGSRWLLYFPTCRRPSASHLPLPPLSTLHRRNNNIAINNKAAASGENVVVRAGAVEVTSEETWVEVKAAVTVKKPIISKLGIVVDEISSLLGNTFQLLLVSNQLDPRTRVEKSKIKSHAEKVSEEKGEIKYEAKFEVPIDFGEVGGVVVVNEHPNEMFLKDIVIHDLPAPNIGPLNVSYLPSETPDGLISYRKEELSLLRGNGKGERKKGERIYDYDVYNDLGDPDTSPDLARPVIGGKENPYPRRCRTGRPLSESDPMSESRSIGGNYVPRDDEFSEVKDLSFNRNVISSFLQAAGPSVEAVFTDADLGFPNFPAIDSLYDDGIKIPHRSDDSSWTDVLPRLIKTTESANEVLQFELPDTMERDRFFWLKDEQFGKQTLAGTNPCCIELIREWPLKSKLDPEVYGNPDSAITTELVERQIRGYMTFDEAIKQKKLFILDYHGILLPFVGLVRQQKGTTLYGSRALFLLTPVGTLKPIAIELTRPPIDGKPLWKRVFTPGTFSSTDEWLWKLAKTHVLAHDVGYHQLISHWLRTHCCTEPYIIAANRQLSALHPIYRLLLPHFRYTLDINALARQVLINAGGFIESCFAPLKYSIQFSSAVYDQKWRFDYEALPKDLIRRGMAVEDPSAPHSLKLTIEDYPYANDGLVLWEALKQWVTDYVNRYYPDQTLVASDTELQSWWTEVRTVGHQDKKDEPWWPQLKTCEDLIEILTTIMWVASGHHAAVNFGQYSFYGYVPNRPPIARKKMPNEDETEEEWKKFVEKPETVLLEMYPSQFQTAKVMAVMNILSGHSEDEEYVGKVMEPSWGDDPLIKAAFLKFSGRLMELEGEINMRNEDPSLRNRNGVGVLPYELLKPFSGTGVTGKGVPNSISI
ncbi:Linoleate 13S-lipoxygenase 2-1, chloroplastic [Linum perenne]